MFSLGQFDRAVLFLQACLEFEVLPLDDAANRIFSKLERIISYV